MVETGGRDDIHKMRYSLTSNIAETLKSDFRNKYN